MTNLLHIDASIRGGQSVSREMSAAFADAWKAAHPEGTYTYRDLHETPPPYLNGDYLAAMYVPEEQRTPEQQAAWEQTQWIRDDVRSADVILLGVPMYNYSVPASVKSWLDHVSPPEFLVDADTGEGVLVGKKVVVVTARGGSYAPGTPKEDWDHQEPLIRAILSGVGLDNDLTFIHTEMVLSYTVEKLAQFRHIHDASRENAMKAVAELAAA
ncbi:NAD(P)H-dependent oxidoreductase [Actinocrispum sp. NPDC049592]|uniref:FMN-dependent NADH-azoreductase n=1 Tax=Actinocrispum sp. NPDC049592 TaxID=3154835 RepID=UPI00341A73D1